MVNPPPESAGWSRAERALAGALRDGWTVVVNVRKSGPHKHLVPWLREAGLLTYVGHAGPRHLPFPAHHPPKPTTPWWPESDFANPFLRQAATDRPGMVRRYREWLADVLADEVNRVQRRPR